MVSDVKVIINLAKPTGKAGTGIPLILAGKETTAVPYTVCGDIDEVKTLFAETTTVYKMAQLLFMQDDAPEKIAVCGSLDGSKTALEKIWDKNFRQIMIASLGEEGEDTLKTISDYVEAKKDKLLFVTINSLSDISTLIEPERTIAFKYGTTEKPAPEAVAALVGATAGLTAGSFTYHDVILKGLEPEEFTTAEFTSYQDKNVICFVEKAGDNVTTDGKSLSGEFIDIIDTKDWLVREIEYRTQRVLNMNKKVSYDNRGISQLESVAVGVLKEGYENGMIAVTDDGLPDYYVAYAPRSETDPNDRLVRLYKLGKFGFGLAGAIHNVQVRGEISI